MKTHLLKFLRGAPGGLRLNRKVITFIFCLIASAFFWLVTVLSRLYTSTINIPVSYVNLPADKVISGQVPESIGIKVKASGYRIIFLKTFKKVGQIALDMKEMKPYKKGFYLTPGNKIDNVSRHFFSEFEIVKILPDTLFFNFDERVDKIVPVKLNLEIDYEKQFNLGDSIRVSPNAIQVSGTGEAVDKIHFVETEKVVINKAREPVSRKVEIIPPSKDVALSISEVNVTIPVVQFTEGSIELPVEVLNLPGSFTVKTFPGKVNLKYMIAYEDYSKVTEQMFKVIADYSKTEADNNRLKVEVKNFPSQYISEKTIKVNPEKVEYIIHKK